MTFPDLVYQIVGVYLAHTLLSPPILPPLLVTRAPWQASEVVPTQSCAQSML